jgi:myosin heavy subunit
VFFRTGELARIEEFREARISEMLVVVQAGARGFLARRTFWKHLNQGQAARIIQRIMRGWLDYHNSLWIEAWHKVKPALKRRELDKELEELDKKAAQERANRDAEAKAKAKVEEKLAALRQQLEALERQLKEERGAVNDAESAKI